MTIFVLDPPVISKGKESTTNRTVRLLPYTDVPEMDCTSRLFRMAQATIAKQEKAALSQTSSPATASTATSPAPLELMFNTVPLGMSTYLNFPR